MKTAPDPIYFQDFLFKQSNAYQISEGFTFIPPACNLLVTDKKRGLLYIGHNDKVTVLKPAEENRAEWKIELQLPGVVSKMAINCDYSYIAIAVALKPTILIYDVYSLVRNSLNLLFEIRLSKVDSYVTDVRWNPTVSKMLCTITSDSTISNIQLKDEEQVTDRSAPTMSVQSKVSNELQALCAAWSPKGKQVAVGCKNGDIIQLKPDLKIARTIAGPSPPYGEVISLLWISNYQFCAAYLDSERRVNVFIVDAPKGEANAIFTWYDDITYGYPDVEGEDSISRYYFEHVTEWGLIIAGNSTSTDIAVLGSTDGGTNWNQWQLADSGRAQLPLLRTTEIFPVGLAVDRSPTNRLQWSADSTLPYPVPILYIFCTSGKLCSFHMVNLMPNCPVINVAPTEFIQPAPSVASGVPSTDISFSMNSILTSTPARPKQPEVVPEHSKPPQITNIFGDSLKAAGFFQQQQQQPPEPPPIQVKPQEEKLVAPVIAPKEAMPPPPPPEPAASEAKLPVKKEVKPSQIIEQQRATIDDSIRMRAYLQEQALFERELQNRLEPQVWECGTDEEKKRLGEACALTEQFLKDLRETTSGLSSDIAYLKALLLQSFAWVEETKSKNAASTDIMSRNCNENSKIADLQRWYYYTYTQLNQVSKILDLEWSEHKAQEMTKMKIPSLEFVYQNLIMHNKIVAKEKEKIEQISRKWKSVNRTSYAVGDVSGLNRSMSKLYVSSPKSPSAIRGNTDVIDARCKTIASKTLSFTHEKQVRLKALLTESPPKIIKPVNPSPIQDRLEATLSSLASLNAPPPTKVKAKPEPPVISKPSTVNKQTVENTKSQSNPLASLNNIVARIGSSDINGVVTQNKTQQKPLPTAASFPAMISTKQTEKKPIISTAPVMTPPKQDLNVNSPSSITFRAPTPKSQEILLPKSPFMDTTAKNNKELTTSDTAIPKTPPESGLFSTGLLKDVLPNAEYPLFAKPEGNVHGFPSLSATPITKTDAAATFSFAASPSVIKSSSTATALDTMMSFTYAKPAHTLATAGGPSVMAVQAPMQAAPIELSALSLGQPSSLTLRPPTDYATNSSANGKANAVAAPTIAAPPAATTQISATTTIAPFVTTMGNVSISLVRPGSTANVTDKPEEVPVSSSAVIIKKVTTPEVKALSGCGAVAAAAQAATSLSATSIFGGQTTQNTEASTTLPATSPLPFCVIAPYRSATSTFEFATSVTTASMFGGFSNTPTVSAASSPASIFQSSLTKSMFGGTTTNIPATSFGVTPSNTSTAATISFGVPAAATAAAAAVAVATTTTTTTTTTTVAATVAATTTTTTTTAAKVSAVSITPVFGKSPTASPASNTQFPNAQTPVSSTNVFGKSIISPASSPFGGTPSGPVFSNMPATSSNSSVFGGNSNMNSIFGPATSLSSTGGSIFGGNSTGFSTNPTGSIFDNTASKPANMFGGATNVASASPFGSSTSNASPAASVTNTSPMGIGAQQPMLGAQPIFGQAPAFGSKPVFGSPPSMFGASKPVFGGGFGSPPTFESPGIGFGAQPTMQSGSTMENVMPKVFGEVAGSSTFESLASQSGGLSFGSLAQKSPESEKPTFTAGSSFSSWR